MITSGSIDWSNRRLGTCGVVLPGYEVRILDPNTLEDVPQGFDGEVCLFEVICTIRLYYYWLNTANLVITCRIHMMNSPSITINWNDI